jgi:hypothetical protein
MSLAHAIEAATGLVNGKDFRCQDDGAGPYIAYWNPANGPAPTPAQQAAYLSTFATTSDKRDGQEKLKQIAQEYLIAFIISREFSEIAGSGDRLAAIKAKITAWKNAHPGVLP